MSIIENTAREPEIVDVATLLNNMGANTKRSRNGYDPIQGGVGCADVAIQSFPTGLKQALT